ncbi:MAG: hypothetical protein HQ564_02360, partial [Candidatus Saganbacteria bacterium]|nr:hypothetical protein [Candidatus Saganbacteria bacterium]
MKKILLGFIGFAVVSIFILGGISYGDIPKILSYQGKLTDSGGTVITATKSMTFNLYSSVTGGSTLWTETQNVTVEAGIYSVLLGSVTALTLDFNTPYYLGVTVGSDSEMTPRKQLASAPSAFNADLLDGLNASSLVSSPASSVQGDILYHDGTSWSRLAAGTSGQFLKTQGSSADPVWAAAGGSGTVTSITAGTGLSGGTIAISGTIAIDNLGVDTAQIAAEAINESKLAGSNAPTDNYLLSYDLASTGFTWVDGSGATLVTNGGTQNLFAGENAGDSITTAQDLAFVGYNVGTAVTTGSYNTALGSTALLSTTTGASNTALGYNALAANTTGQNNIAVGVNALATNNASDNLAMGGDSLTLNTTGTQNTALGRDTLKSNTTADDNTAVGFQALDLNTTGAENTAIGSAALGANTTGTDNTAVGYGALDANTTASDNTALGSDSLGDNTTGTF